MVTASRYMPPWLPTSTPNQYHGQRGLTGEQIETIQKWVESGAPQGDPAHLPPAPKFKEGWQLGEPDMIVTMPEPYELQADGNDVYRNFVVPVTVPSRRYIRAVEFRPDNLQVVHHGRIEIDRTRSSRQADQREAELGFGGMINVGAHSPNGHWLGWTPGKRPFVSGEGMAWVLERGTDFVVQLHMLPSGKPEQVNFKIRLFFDDKPPTQLPYVFMIGSNSLDIPPGEKNYAVRDSYVLPVDVYVRSVLFHAHYLGKEMTAEATLPDGSVQQLLAIRDWDFNWQDDYRLTQPVFLPKGTTLSMRILYDNSTDNVRNPNIPPKRVTYGSGTSDEMANFILQVLTKNNQDRQFLIRNYAKKMLALELEGLQKEMGIYPDNVLLHYYLGRTREKMGMLEEAAEAYRQALELPNPSTVYNDLGNVLQSQGKLAEAIQQYILAIEIKPDFAPPHNNWGIVLARQGDFKQALAKFEEVLRIDPHYDRARDNRKRVKTMLV